MVLLVFYVTGVNGGGLPIPGQSKLRLCHYPLVCTYCITVPNEHFGSSGTLQHHGEWRWATHSMVMYSPTHFVVSTHMCTPWGILLNLFWPTVFSLGGVFTWCLLCPPLLCFWCPRVRGGTRHPCHKVSWFFSRYFFEYLEP